MTKRTPKPKPKKPASSLPTHSWTVVGTGNPLYELNALRRQPLSELVDAMLAKGIDVTAFGITIHIAIPKT